MYGEGDGDGQRWRNNSFDDNLEDKSPLNGDPLWCPPLPDEYNNDYDCISVASQQQLIVGLQPQPQQMNALVGQVMVGEVVAIEPQCDQPVVIHDDQSNEPMDCGRKASVVFNHNKHKRKKNMQKNVPKNVPKNAPKNVSKKVCLKAKIGTKVKALSGRRRGRPPIPRSPSEQLSVKRDTNRRSQSKRRQTAKRIKQQQTDEKEAIERKHKLLNEELSEMKVSIELLRPICQRLFGLTHDEYARCLASGNPMDEYCFIQAMK